ncbi:MFS transporter [Pullulanibacillus camelliae]|uniref:MFS transporter n=1 Tax=Pullulanibacillus camelliae TaxID=1707096 RepID=A0A8J2VMK2_9BACL|nr:MFS transporter [Pullulanibacillus camelliae]GGE33555.1 MFS transporter [Pullulanibacillus camelliae]
MSMQQAKEKVNRKWWALGAVCFGLFMALLDVTIVNVALPAIQSDLKTNFSNLEWVISAYTLVFAVALVTASRLGDIFGRKTLFILGLSVFTIGSLLCALSSDWTIGSLSPISMLNISRGIQGLGASAMMPLSLAIISATFTGKQRGMAIGIWGGISGLATAIGPLVGGILVDKISWQSIFYLNVPIGIVGVLLSLWAITQSKDETAEKKVDVFGLITFTIFMFCLVFGFIKVNDADLGWTSPEILGLWGMGALAIIIFIIGEAKLKHPMIDPRLFKIPSFTGAAVAAFCLSAGMYALLFYLSLYFQNFLGFDALEAGMRFLTFTAISFLMGPIAGMLMGKFSPKWLIVVALGLLAIGVGLMTGISPQDKAADWVALLPGFIVAGVGNGLINPPISNLAIGTVARYRAGMASGVNNVARQIGIAFGTAFFGALLANRYTTFITNKIQALNATGLTPDIKEKMIKGLSEAGPIAGSTGLSGTGSANPFQSNPLFPTIKEIARSSFVEGTSNLIMSAAIILAIGAIACIFLIRKHDMKH